MPTRKRRYTKFWLGLVVALIISTIGAGFYKELSAGNEETYKGLKLFSDVIELVEKNYVDTVDSEELIHKAIQGMVQSLDPHSQFLPPEALEELKVDTRGEFGGIGIVITMRQGVLTVISPIEGTPAYKAGIMAGDIITKVDNEPTQEMMLWEAVRKMRGPKGTAVTLLTSSWNPLLQDFVMHSLLLTRTGHLHILLASMGKGAAGGNERDATCEIILYICPCVRCAESYCAFP